MLDRAGATWTRACGLARERRAVARGELPREAGLIDAADPPSPEPDSIPRHVRVRQGTRARRGTPPLVMSLQITARFGAPTPQKRASPSPRPACSLSARARTHSRERGRTHAHRPDEGHDAPSCWGGSRLCGSGRARARWIAGARHAICARARGRVLCDMENTARACTCMRARALCCSPALPWH